MNTEKPMSFGERIAMYAMIAAVGFFFVSVWTVIIRAANDLHAIAQHAVSP